MKLKKVAMSMSLSLILLMSNVPVLATNGEIQNHIPKYMDPGTTITFDKNCKIKILNEGKKTEFSKNKSEDINEEDLPVAKEGMIVNYDALGQPIVINKAAREQYSVKVEVKKVSDTEITEDTEKSAKSVDIIESLNNNLSIAVAQRTQTGKTTYYYAAGKIGESGSSLDEWSAAHMSIPFWTMVHLYDSNSTKATVVYVLDRGNFAYPVILDIDYQRFITFYPASQGWFDSKITWYQ